MATKKTVVSEVASALGAAAARVENFKPKKAVSAKHVKAKVTPSAAVTPAEIEAPAPALSEREEVEIVAYLYSESRGFQGGSPEEDWLRAEAEVRQRRTASA